MEKDTKIETFRAYLLRKCFLHYTEKEPKESWNRRNRGENVAAWDGKNVQKRQRREANKIDRLAHIRWARSPFGGNSTARVPKLKRVPQSVFA